MDAFAATLEELNDADLLLHIVDATSPRLEKQVDTVKKILVKLGLKDVPALLLLNKTDLLEAEKVTNITKKMGGIAISAIAPPSLLPLLESIEAFMWPRSSIRQI